MLGQIFFICQVAKLGKLTVPEKFDRAGRTVTLLADDDFSQIGGFAVFCLPFFYPVLEMFRGFILFPFSKYAGWRGVSADQFSREDVFLVSGVDSDRMDFLEDVFRGACADFDVV